MKKLAFFIVIFVFLANLGWGQNTYRHNGTWFWEQASTWTVLDDDTRFPLDPQPATFPGQNPPYNDTVIFNDSSIQISQHIRIGTLEIRGTTETYFAINDLFEVENLILDNRFNFTGSSPTVHIKNITVTNSGERMGPGLLSMNGSTVIVPHDAGTLTINPVVSDLGKINAGSRNVTLTIPGNGGNINIDDITTTGTVTINVTGNNNVVNMKDISAIGNILVNDTGSNNIINIGDIKSDGTVTINSGPGGSVSVDSSDPPPIGTGNVTVGGTNIVVGTWDDGDQPNDLLGAGIDYYYIDIKELTSGDTVTTADINYPNAVNIYIINVGDIGTRSFTFSAPNGYIEFRQIYTTTGALTLNPGSGGVRFTDGTIINLGSNDFVVLPPQPYPAYNMVTLNGIVSITAANVRLLEIAGSGILNVTGNLNVRSRSINNDNIVNINASGITVNVTNDVSFGPDDLPGPNLPTTTLNSVSAASVTLRAPITTTGDQTYGSVTLFSNTPGSAIRTLTGATVTINGAITSTWGSTATPGDIALQIVGNAVFNTAFTVRTLEVTGTTGINANITTSGNATIATIANATQVYGGAVTLGAANITLTGPAGTLRPIRFNGTVNGVTSGAQSLTITTGNPWFAQAVGGLVPLDRVSVTGTGVTTIHANIITAATTGNGQDYNGNVTLGATANLTGGSGSTIRFGGTVTGAFGLTLTDANVLFTGIVGVTGTRLTNVTVNGTGTTTINAANIWTGTGGQTYNGNVILGNNVTLTGNVNTLIRFNGTVNSDAAARQLTIGTANAWFDQGAGNTAALTSITVAGITQINANITTTGIQTYGAVTLGGTPAGTRTLAGSIITANGVITGGDNSLTVNSAAGIAMNAAAGNNVSTVILNNTGATGAISYNSNRGANNSLNISAVNSAATGGNITITEATGNIIVGAGGIRTATQQGLIGLTATVGSITVTGNIGSVTAQNGNVTLSALSAGENISITGTIDCYQLIALTNRTDGVIAVNGNININELNPGNGSTGFGLVTCTVPSTIYFNAFNFEPNENNIINPGGGQLCLDLGTPYQAGHFNTFVNGNYHMHNLFRHLVYYSASSGNTLNNNVNNIAALIVKYPDFSESTHRFINIDPSVITADDFNSSAPATNYQPPPDMHLYFTDIGHTTVRLVLIASNAAFVEFRGYNSFQNWFANDVFDTKGGGIRLNNTHLAFPDMGTNSLLNKVTLVGNTNGSSSQISITALGINLGIDHGVLGTGSINVEGNNIDLTLNAIGPVWDQPGINAPDSSVAIFKSIPAGIRNLIINSSSTESPYNINLLGNLDVETLTINATTNIGSIRQPAVGTSVIKANTVNINATGAVTLNNPGNEVNTLTITNAGGAVQFINNASLVLAGIACGSQNITLTTTGTASAITQSSGTIINTTGALTLNATGDINLNENNNVGTLQITGAGSAVRFTNNSTFSVSGINAASSAVSLISNANLNITGVITCERLALQTAATGTIDIGSGITVASNNATHDNTAALYITTGSLDGAGGITLNSSTGTACVNLHTALNYTGTVNDLTRIHYHFNTAANTNIVYRPGVNTPAALTFAQPYFYINSNSPLGASLNHSTTGTGSIYIIDVDNSAPANSRSVTFATAASGFIEVRGIYTSSGALNLTPGDGGVRLRDATINITGNDFSCPFPGAVILNGETGSTITADDIRLGDITGNGNSLTLTASNSILNSSININALLINGNALFGDALPPVSVISAFSVTVTGNCILRSGVTTTGTGNFQDYESIELYSTQAAAAERILTGETITTNGVNGGGCALTINGNVTFNGATNNNIRLLTVNTGTAIINGNIVSTTGGQVYNGPVRLNNNITFTGNANTTIRFANTVSSNNSTPQELTVATAIVRFDNTVGGDPNFPIARVNATGTPTGTNTHQINANITTVATTDNGQNYTGNVTLGANVNLTSGAGSTVQFGGTVNSNAAGAANARALTITNANVEFNGIVGGGNALASITVNANPATNTPGVTRVNANITTSGIQSYAEVELVGVMRTLISTGGSISASGVVTGSNGITVNASQGITMNADNVLSGNVTLNNTQGTSANNISFGSTLGITLSSTNNAANGQIVLTQSGALVIAGLRTSTVTPATGSIVLGVSPQAVGNITQTGIITTGSLTINSSGVITLTDNNAVGSLAITGAGGAVKFTNNAALSITSINGTLANDVDILSDTGSITVNGNIDTTGAIKLTSGNNQNITINGTSIINCDSLALKTGPSDASTGVVTINGSITVTGNIEDHDDEDAVYIYAGSLAGTGSIWLGASSWVCADLLLSYTYSGTVTDDRIHFHTRFGRNIVYSIGPLSGFNTTPPITEPYFYLQADMNLSSSLSLDTSGNIYIVNIGNTVNANSRSINFTTTGFIEVRGGYTSSGTLTLNPGTGGLRLRGAVINISNNPFNANSAVLTLVGGTVNSITASNITLNTVTGIDGANNDLTLNAGSGNVNLNGLVGTNIRDFRVTGTGININTNVTTTGPQVYNGPVIINGARDVTGAAGAANTIEFTNTINGSERLRVITANARFYGQVILGEFSMGSAAGNGGTAYIRTGISTSVTTGTGNNSHRYRGPVVLENDVTFIANTGTVIRFDGAVSGGFNLTASNNTNVRFAAAVGGGSPLRNIDIYGTTTLNTDVTFTGINAATSTFRFRGTVSSFNATARALTITNANVIFDSNVGAASNPITSVVVNTGTATINGNIVSTTGGQTYNGPVRLNNNITFTGNANTTIRFANIVSSNDNTPRELTVSTAIVRFDNTVGGDSDYPIARVNATGTPTGTNTHQINADITTTATIGNGQNYTGNLTLGANVNLTSGAESAIRFGGTVNSNVAGAANARALNITNANVEFNGVVGGGNVLASIIVNANPVTNTPGVTRINANINTINNQSYAAVNLDSVTRILTSTNGSISASGVVTGPNGITVNASQGITMNADNVLSGIVTLNNTQGTSANNISFGNTGDITLSSINNAANGQIVITQSGELIVNGLRTSTATPATGSIILGISPQTVGDITQTEIITTGSLTINSSGVITLINDNTVSSLTITGAGGAVQFTNNAALSIAGINGLTGVSQDVSIITNSIGSNISQSGTIITDGILSLTSSGTINLNNSGNNIRTLTIPSAGGAVDFNNTGMLTINGISAGSNNVTIETTGAITVNNSITTTGDGTLRLTSGKDEDITIGAAINSYNLILAAGNHVESEGIVYINNVITVRKVHPPDINASNCYDNAAVHIFAGELHGNGSINLPGDDSFVCADILIVSDYSGNVTGDRIHYHSRSGMHIVYSTEPKLTSYPGITGPYLFLQANSDLGSPLNVLTSGSGNIYIIEVENVTYANTRSVIFTTGTDGNIEFRGNYTSSGTLTLIPGTDGVYLNNANINLTGSTNPFITGTVTLNGTVPAPGSEITASAITLGNITGNNNDLTLTGTATLNGGTDIGELQITGETAFLTAPINALSVNVTGNSTIGTNINTTGSTGQVYNGNVTLTASIHLNAGTNPVTLGNTAGRIAGGNNALTITGNAVLNGTSTNIGVLQVNGNAVFQTALLTAVTVNVSGNSTINHDITTTAATGTVQVYTGPVTIGGAARNLTGITGSTILFSNTLNGAQVLTVTNANVIFSDQVGNDEALTGIIVNGNGTATINANTYTTGDQNYTGNVIINNNVTISTTTGNQTFGADQNDRTVTLNGNTIFTAAATAAIRFNGAVIGTGTIDTTAGITRVIRGITTYGNQTYNSAVTVGTGTAAGPVVFTANTVGSAITFEGTIQSNSETAEQLSITSSNIIFKGSIGSSIAAENPIAGVTANGSVTITAPAAFINTTTGGQTYNGSVTLGNNINFTGNAGTVVWFNGTVNGDNNIRTLNITAAHARFDGIVGGGIGLSSITVTDGEARINANISTVLNQSYASVNLGSVTRTLASTDGNITASGVVQGTAGIIVNASTGITMDAANTLGGSVSFNIHRTGAAGIITFRTNAAIELRAVNNTNDGQIIINQSGTITQAMPAAGVIITDTLVITSSGAVTLNNTDNNIRRLIINGAGGAIELVNTGTLDVDGVSAAGNNVRITSTQAIKVTGDITNAGTVILTSKDEPNNPVTQVIAISADIDCFSLALIVGDRSNVLADGTVTIDGDLTINSPNESSHNELAAVFVWAGILNGSGNIYLVNEGWVCVDLLRSFLFTGTVTPHKIHYHSRENINIVYRPGIDDGTHGVSFPYLYLPANYTLGSDFEISARGTGSIYIIDITDINGDGSNQANTRNVIFTTGQNGIIEFRGEYISSGLLTVNAGDNPLNEGILLNNANIRLSGDMFRTHGSKLTLLQTSVLPNGIIASGIILDSGIYGKTSLNDSLKLDATGNITITGTAGTSDINLGDIVIERGNVTFSNTSTVFANSYQQDNGNAIFNAEQNYYDTFNFNSSGVVILAANLTANGGIIVNNELQLAANVNLKTIGKNVELNTITRDATAGRSLVIDTLDLIDTNPAGNVNVLGDIGTTGASLGNITITAADVDLINLHATGYIDINGADINLDSVYSTGFIDITGADIELININTTGKTTIDNSGVFTANAPIISNDGFEQKGNGSSYLGTSGVQADITTIERDIVFTGDIVLNNNIKLDTGNNTGDISLAGLEGAGRNMILSAVAGDININGDIGVIAAIGDITITGTRDASFIGDVKAADITITSTRDTSFNGMVNAANIMLTSVRDAVFESEVNAADIITSNARNVSINDTMTTSGIIEITVSDNLTVNSGGDVLPAGKLTINGNTVNHGRITAGPIDASDTAIDFIGNYIASANGALVGNAVTNPDIQFHGNVTLGLVTHNNNSYIFTGGGMHELSVVSSDVPVLADVIIRRGNSVKLNNSYIRQDNEKSLTLEDETNAIINDGALLDIYEGSWHIGVSGTADNDFAGINGILNLGTGSKVILNNLNILGDIAASSSFTVYIDINDTRDSSERVYFKIFGDVRIADAEKVEFDGDLSHLVFEMVKNGRQDLITDQTLGSLRINENSQTILGTNNSDKTIYISGDVIIYAQFAPSGLDAGDLNIVMYAGLIGNRNTSSHLHNGTNEIYYTRWEIPNVTIPSAAYPLPPFAATPNMNNFVFRQNSDRNVSFKRYPGFSASVPVFFEIVGNTMWQEFECHEPGAVVQFSRHPNHHTFLESFSIRGAGDHDNTAGYVTITRLTEKRLIIDNEDYGNFPYIYDPNVGVPPKTELAGGSDIPGTIGDWALPVYFPPMDLKNSVEAEKRKYWNINIINRIGHRPLENFECVKIYFSHAYNSRIPIQREEMRLEVVPYYRDTPIREGFFNFDWIELRKILYSFTEDSTGNGRLDRIRVQTNISLNGDFSSFDVRVDGYEINRNIEGLPGFNNGFQMAHFVTGFYEFDNDSFYIYLKEKPEIDGGNTPTWTILHNDSLKDMMTERTFVGEPHIDIDIKPFDTIPPRVAYTLTLPEYPQTYVRMSEPVVSSSNALNSFSANGLNSELVIETSLPYIFTWTYFTIDGAHVDFFANVPLANLGYLLNWQNHFSITTLAALANIQGDATSSQENGYFQINDIVDQGQRAMSWNDPRLDPAFYIYYQAPKYPLNWGYTEYAKVYGNSHLTGQNRLLPDDFSEDEPDAATAAGTVPINNVFMPPNKLLTVDMMTDLIENRGHLVTPSRFASYDNPSETDIVTRRITDTLISIPPGSNNSDNYFAWPVWARFNDPDAARIPGLFTDPGSNFWGDQFTDTGIIWEFDGTKYLEARGDVELQARINSTLTGMNLDLFWAANIPSSLRIPKEDPVRGRSSGGLWLPGNNLLYYFAPVNNDNINTGSVLSAGFPLYNYIINGTSSGNRIEFIFRFRNSGIISDMFIARLDVPRGTVNPPGNWYQLVRPFSFDIQDMRTQRGGVSIMNNVINSDNREVVYLRYNLVRPGRVTIQVHTLDGTLVRSLVRNEHRAAGEWTEGWDGTNNNGRPIARGMYFIRVVGPDIDEIRKVMVIRN